MRIGDLNPAAAKLVAAEMVEKLSAESAQQPIVAPEDAVELSRLSQVVAASGPSETRLEQLRLEVQAGAYQVPAEHLARNIVDFHKE